MRDRDLYSKLLGVEAPWRVKDVDVRMETSEVEVFIEHSLSTKLKCPSCGAKCLGYDTRTRTRRHLDTMQVPTLLTADVPRVECAEHGVMQVEVPWAEAGSRFTALLEKVVIDWLREAYRRKRLSRSPSTISREVAYRRSDAVIWSRDGRPSAGLGVPIRYGELIGSLKGKAERQSRVACGRQRP